MEHFENVPSAAPRSTDDAPAVTGPLSPTDAFNATETPYATDASNVTETPYVADASGATETPYATDASGATETPYATDASNATETPYVADASGAMETPYVADASGATETPYVADASGATQTPYVADASGATQTPYATENPSAVVELRKPDPAPESVRTPAPDAPPVRPRRRVRRRRHQWIWSFLCGMVVAGLLALCGRLWEQRRYIVSDPFVWNFRDNEEEPKEELPRGDDLSVRIPTWPIGDGPVFTLFREHGQTQSAQEIYRTVNPSVVTVIVAITDETAAVGTGVIFSPDGYFVTNYHVVQGGSECRALLDNGRSYPALYVAGDEKNDLAVLKMDNADPLPAAQFGDSEQLTVGDDVYAIGNPLGIEFRGTLTNGIVSAINRDVLVDGRTMTLIQTNAALNSGNSGGPLINEYGQVVGINVVKMSSRRSTVEGLGFAIPSAAMERLVNDLLTYGENQPEPIIGVSVDPYGTEVEPGVWGIRVQKVESNSPAERAGVQLDDYIIFADEDAVSSSRDLLRVRRRYHMGETMSLTLWRNGERLEVSLTFAE